LASSVAADQWRLLYSENPVIGVIDGFRRAILGGELTLDWPDFLLGWCIIVFFLWLGSHQFRGMEKRFADLISVGVASMVPDPVITTLADELNCRLGTHLRGLWLYGSRARGDARATSDYDVLIIVDEKTPAMRERILDLQVEILDRYEALVATLLRTETEWHGSQGSPLARNIAREAVRL